MPRKPYKGKERRSGRARRKLQSLPRSGTFVRTLGKGIASEHNFLPTTITVRNQRAGPFDRREKKKKKG